ncbi:MAG: DUF4964 domain-containing protein, partial [Bacteroidales bacterium]|nr:DUF4964 domain-containing protein [Bacteroidales bacterium]
MKYSRLVCGLVAATVLCSCSEKETRIVNELRAPAYPLVTIDPYTSAWSAADHLYDIPVKHWTGKDFPLIGVLKVDGEDYRFLGAEESDSTSLFTRTAEQVFAEAQPTRTIYGFTCGPVDLELTFMAPLLLDDLELVSRPVNYISYSAKSNDGKKHDLKVYFEASPLWAVDNPSQNTATESF